MNVRTNKTQENKSKAAANNLSKEQASGENTFQFSDNRPEAVVQRKLQEIVNDGTEISQLKSVQSPPIQRKRERKDEKQNPASAQLKSSDSPVQMMVGDDVPDGTRIVIENPGASDFGDTGTIIRRSRVEKHCMAVRFDNEPDVLYRVYNYEMSPLTTDKKDAYKGSPTFFSLTAGNGENDVLIMGEFDLSGEGTMELTFTASYKGNTVGQLSITSIRGETFYLSDIKTLNADKGPKLEGLGTVLLQIASTMAIKFDNKVIELEATKKKEKHPAPFYEKFGFTAPQAFGMELAKYLESIKDGRVNMIGNPREVNRNTTLYIAQKGWAMSGWRIGK